MALGMWVSGGGGGVFMLSLVGGGLLTHDIYTICVKPTTKTVD